ncbi:ankyrin repeat domain-containing protein [Nocardia thailandica]|uniref:Ankyrin repeat domain-containing protein n=1 Tax=Nocardia thailandica TaxID=257275 RepID=A0ABW6PXE5_9NOCA
MRPSTFSITATTVLATLLLAACGPGDAPGTRNPDAPAATATTGPATAANDARTAAPPTPDPAADRELLRAAVAEDVAAVRAALADGAAVDVRDGGGRTPLFVAVLHDDVEVARVLLAAGADPDVLDDRGESPWVNTGVTGSVAMLDLLLPADPDVGLPNRFGGTALHPAAERGHVDYVREVLARTGIDVNRVNRPGWTALLEAVHYGDGGPAYQEIVRLLLAHGADPAIRDVEGRTAYDHAVEHGYPAIADLLRGR